MKRPSLFGYTFLVLGLAMIVAAYFFHGNMSAFVASATSVQGEVVDNARSSDGLYRSVVTFKTQQGETVTFTSSHSSNPPAHRRGQPVSVLYLPANPESARINDMWSMSGLWIAWAGLGAVFAALGPGMTGYGILERRRITYLRGSGVPIEATLMAVERNTRFSFNDQHPFQIVAQWHDPATRTVHLFKSDNIGLIRPHTWRASASKYLSMRRIRTVITWT